MGAAPGGSTGTSARLSVHRVRSTRLPHASAPTPTAPIASATAAAGEGLVLVKMVAVA